METPIVIKYKFAAEQLLKSQDIHLRHSPIGYAYRFCKIVGLLALAIGTAIMILMKDPFPGFFCLVAGVNLFVLPIAMRAYFRHETLKHFTKRPDRDMEVEWVITSDQLISSGVGGKTESQWTMISRVMRTPEGFLLYPNDKVFHWIPAHGFQNPADMERLARIAQSKMKAYQDVSS